MRTSHVTTTVIGSLPLDHHSVRNFVCLDTRSREIHHKTPSVSDDSDAATPLIVVRQYPSSNGSEYFISIEDRCGYLYGFARLCLPHAQGVADILGLDLHTAMVRELHVYGQVVTFDRDKQSDWSPQIQHTGIGTQLMHIVEELARVYQYHRVSVISGVGVRNYYRKLWYTLVGTYMCKTL